MVSPSICGFTDLKKLPPELSTFLWCKLCQEPNQECYLHSQLHYQYFLSKLIAKEKRKEPKEKRKVEPN